MKVLKLFTFLLIATINLKAQSIFPGVEIKDPESFERGMQAAIKSEFIFEGTVIEQKYYKSPTDGSLYTLNEVELYKIFKGVDQISCGTVTILTRGGIDVQSEKMEDLPIHSEYYKKGSTGIFFCITNDKYYKEASPNITSTNPILMRTTLPMYGACIKYEKSIFDIYSIDEINGAASGFLGIKFKSLSDLYAYIQDAYNLDLTQVVYCSPNNALVIPVSSNGKVIQKHNTNNDALNTTYEPIIRKSNSQIYLNYIANKLPSIQKHQNRDNGTLQYTIENETVTGNGPKYLEFDINMLASGSGTFIDNSPIYLIYSTSAFGDSIFGRGNITVTNGAVLSSPTYLDPMTYSGDKGIDTILLAIGTDFNVVNKVRTEAPTGISSTLVHVKIKIKNCHQYSGIFFAKQVTMNSFTWHTVSANAASPTFFYDDVITTGSLNDKTCDPLIDDVSPTRRAGTGDVIVIHGKYFGASRGNGEVMVKDANDGGNTFIRKQDPIDYTLWDDHEIRLYTTSTNNIYPIAGKSPVMGSGKVWVKADRGDSTESSQDMYIPFAIVNAYDMGTNVKKIEHLADQEPIIPQNRVYRCDTAIGNHPNIKACVQKAIDIWNCRTGVNWTLGTDTTLSIPSKTDGISYIFFNPNQHGAPIANTQPRLFTNCTLQQNQEYMGEADISLSIDFSTINPNYGWFYDATGTIDKSANKFDFLRTILHELGHAHSIDHNNDINDLMYYGQNAAPFVYSYDRFDKLGHWVTSTDAGNWIINKSLGVNWSSCGYSNFVRTYPTNCSSINGIKEIEVAENSFVSFPNPANTSTLGIKLNMTKNASVDIAIYDISGKLILQDKNVNAQSGDNLFELNISTLAKGSYFINISNESFSTSQKLIVY